MAVTAVTTAMAGAINYTVVTDSSADWASVSNSTYFYDKVTKLVYFKNSSGTVLEIFSEIGPTGATGSQGITGPTGSQGNIGATGPSGTDTSLLSINSQSSNYTLQLSDKGNLVEMSSSSSLSLTVPLDSSVLFPEGSQILVVRGGTGSLGLTGSTGVTLNSSQNYLNLNYQYSAATLVKKETNVWYVFGDLKA